MPQKQVLISVDGGGTKTEFCVHDLASNSDKFFTYGSTNYKTVGVETAEENLVNAFTEICRDEVIALPQIKGMVMGLAGYDSDIDIQVFQEMAASLGLPEEKLFLCNDCELAFRAAANPPGICTVAGTGSIAFGFDNTGAATRCGGWGGLLSDEGSGYWIASRVLRRMLLHCDGMDAFEPVFDMVRDFYGGESLQEMPFILTRLNITDIAASAKPIMDFAQAGDPYCNSVVREAARLVSQLTVSLSDRIGIREQPDISFVVTGGLFRDRVFYESYLACLESRFQRALKLLHIKERTSQNGIQLAMRLFNA
jgi:N-acetylglucosamine kinase-like BadF-type ATPase